MGELGNGVSGSDELSLLTQKSITALQASQPFFVYARLNAAKTASPADQVRLYREAIAFDPSLHEPRLDLASSALRTKQATLGLAAFDSYQASQYQTEPAPSSTDTLAAVEEMAAAAFTQRKNYTRAIDIYIELSKQTRDTSKQAQFQQAKRDAEEKQMLESLNSARQPVVTNEIAQRVVVKPKLSALPSDTDIPGAQRGGVQ